MTKIKVIKFRWLEFLEFEFCVISDLLTSLEILKVYHPVKSFEQLVIMGNAEKGGVMFADGVE